MIEQIQPDIYKIEIPLPKNPLKALNSYFIRGRERNLLIDTGFNSDACRDAMNQALSDLGANMETTDIFLTHLHSDHSGLINYLATPSTKVLMSEVDAKLLVADHEEDSFMTITSDYLHLSGLISEGVANTPELEPGYKYASKFFTRFTMLKDGQEIKIANYCFRCVETAGHSPGHLCLYEQEKKLLISGDHILGTITPNITLWFLGEDVLGDYLQSLDKIAALEIDLVLPGHRSLITDCRGRIEEIKYHHEERLAEIIKLLGKQKMNAAQVARQMKWDLSYKSWNEYPWGQKLFATGEALAHLYHLCFRGLLEFSTIGGIVYFEKK